MATWKKLKVPPPTALRNILLEKFQAQTARTPTCWEWVGLTGPGGHAMFWWYGGRWFAHRMAWYLVHGDDGGDLELIHQACGNRRCVRVNRGHVMQRPETEDRPSRRTAGRRRGHVFTSFTGASPEAVRAAWASEDPDRCDPSAAPRSRNRRRELPQFLAGDWGT